MKLKAWLVRLGCAALVGLVAPVIYSGALLLVPGLADFTVGEAFRLSAEAPFMAVYSVLFLLSIVLLMLFLAIVQPMVEKLEADDREEGLVKWFNVSKGFGFLTRESGEDVFVHFRSIRGRGHRSLQEGQRVRFGVVESSKGLQAEDVSIIRQR